MHGAAGGSADAGDDAGVAQEETDEYLSTLSWEEQLSRSVPVTFELEAGLTFNQEQYKEELAAELGIHPSFVSVTYDESTRIVKCFVIDPADLVGGLQAGGVEMDEDADPADEQRCTNAQTAGTSACTGAVSETR